MLRSTDIDKYAWNIDMASSSSSMKAGPSKSAAGLTTLMQDRQARNKPLMNSDEDEGSDITK